MKYAPIAVLAFLLAALATLARAQDTNFGVRVPCEMQATSGESEPRLATLTWLQGTTPLVVAEPLRRGRAIPHDADTRVRMVIGPSATGTLYAVRTNAAAVTNGYAVQWPTVGTNTAGAAWFYTILFDKDGRTYWTGSGDLWLKKYEPPAILSSCAAKAKSTGNRFWPKSTRLRRRKQTG